MLAPIAPKRRDGGSSFSDLKNYLTHEVEQETGLVISRGDYLLSENLLGFDTAELEMRGTAAENARCKDPVYHYLLSWQTGENPTRQQWEEAVKKTIDDLGFTEHQYLAIAHTDTDNFHAHVMVNRVHPETYKAHYPQFTKRTLDKSMREIEAAQGWKESNGLYRWDAASGKAVKTEPELMAQYRQERESQKHEFATGKAAKMEIFGHAESLQGYCKGEPAKEIKELMRREGVTWQDIHTTLKKHGLELQANDYTKSNQKKEKKEHEQRQPGRDRDHRTGAAFSDPRELTALRQSYARAVAERPEAGSLNSVRTLSGVGVVSFGNESKMLLSGNASDNLEHGGSKRDAGMRRSDHGGSPTCSGTSNIGYTVKAIGSDIAVKASDVFRDTFAGKANREKLAEKLGPYTPPARFVNVIDTEQEYKPAREPARRELKRDPEKRAQRREERAQVRQQLKDEYAAYKKAAMMKRSPDKAEAKRRSQAITAEAAARRAQIRHSQLSPEMKKAALSVTAMETVKMREALRADQAAERKASRPQGYPEWVADRAEEGNEAAISQLRGFSYAEKRRAKDLAEAERNGANTIRSAIQLAAADPVARNIDGVSWKVNRRTGDVAYKIGGQDAFTDIGNRIVFAGKKEVEHQSIEVGLKLARQKYGNTLVLNGSNEFKRQCVEAAVKARMEVSFNDPAMIALKRQLEQQRERDHAQGGPQRGRNRPGIGM